MLKESYGTESLGINLENRFFQSKPWFHEYRRLLGF